MCDVVTSNQLKRKRTSSLSEDDEKTDSSTCSVDDDRLQLRHRVVELSLAKVRTAAPLTRSLRRREPSLRRSVLILNTLRAVDADAAAETTMCVSAAVAPPSTPCRVLDDLPGALLLGSERLLATPSLPADFGEHFGDSVRSADDDATTSSILDDLFGCDRTSALPLSPPPILTFSSLFDLDSATVWPSTASAATTSSSTTSPSPSSSLSSLSSFDVDFDLDLPMFDFDPLLPPLTPPSAATGVSRTATTSPPAVVPAASGVGGGVLASSSSSSTCTQRSQTFVDELERIAQILVGT